jgi:carbonic anhydrase
MMLWRVVLLTLLVVQNCQAKDWSYTPYRDQKAAGPDQWHLVDANCLQQGTQSPINAVFKEAVIWPNSFPDPNLTVAAPKECMKAQFVVNRHTTEVNFGETCPGSFDLTWKGKKFSLLQFHWHSPAEHTLDGKHYAMEVHHVYIAADKQLLVMGIFMDADKPLAERCKYASMSDIAECHRAQWFDTLLRQRFPHPPYTPGGVRTLEASPIHNPFTEFIPPMDKHYYHYSGSLTTPGCGPNVEWILNPTPVKIFDSSLTLYRNMINSVPQNRLFPNPAVNEEFANAPFSWNAEQGTNNRPVQPLRGKDNPIRELYKVHVNLPSKPSGAHAVASLVPGPWMPTSQASSAYNGTVVIAGFLLALFFLSVFLAARGALLRKASMRQVANCQAGVALADTQQDLMERPSIGEA